MVNICYFKVVFLVSSLSFFLLDDVRVGPSLGVLRTRCSTRDERRAIV